MTYLLRIDPTMHKVYASMPLEGRMDLGVCLLDAMPDPVGHSAVYGEDDGIFRTVARGLVTAAITIDHEARIMTVVHITYAG